MTGGDSAAMIPQTQAALLRRSKSILILPRHMGYGDSWRALFQMKEGAIKQFLSMHSDRSRRIEPATNSPHFIFEGSASALSDCFDGRGGGIRTPDPLLPKQMRYQTALRPDSSSLSHRPSQRAEKPVGACPEQRMEQAIEDPRK